MSGAGKGIEMIEFKCPHCGKTYEIEEVEVGRMFECSGCGNLFHAPSQRCCPNCQNLLDPGTAVCIRCGYNLETGERLETQIHKVDETPAWLKFLRFMYDLMPGLFRPLMIIAFILCLLLSIILAWLGLVVLGFGIVFSGIAICSASLIVYAQGVAFLLAGEFQILKSALVDFTERQMTAFIVLVFGPCALIVLVMVLIGRVINNIH